MKFASLQNSLFIAIGKDDLIKMIKSNVEYERSIISLADVTDQVVGDQED